MVDQIWKDNFTKAKRAFLNKDVTTVHNLAQEAKDYYIKNGFVSAEPLFKWIEKDWLKKGLSVGAIVCKNGLYFPIVQEIEVEVITSYRGRTPLTKKGLKLDTAKFFLFMYEYEQYKKTMEIYRVIL